MKRIRVIKTGENIGYVIEKRVLFLFWLSYNIYEYIIGYNHDKKCYYFDHTKICDVVFETKQEAEYAINWKNIKYLGKWIRFGWSSKNDKMVYYVFNNKSKKSIIYNKIFDTIEEAKQYIESLPRTINIYDNYK